ncbi:glycoside hydrolase family 15 protein [Streptomyces avicenniae]|uniref:glycoside hydrolase family 15 protein n=1 Tax=Streptomyces avicenniae TaxID=500153 RepID=UPI00069AA7B2|nr:glycoside hydrolase family 15 protein [Streptomyces avicenniae]
MPTPDHRRLAARSLAVITGHQDPGGGYPAAPDYPVYGFSWLRDGSFIAEAASRAGAPGSATAFHTWCARAVTERAERVRRVVAARRAGERPAEGDFLPTRYTLDGQDPDVAGWGEFQTDGYGTWLWALTAHLERHRLDPAPYRSAVTLTVDYLAATWDLPCNDWWEESDEERHGSTLGAIHGGLAAAARAGLAEPAAVTPVLTALGHLVARHGTHEGRLTKWLGGEAVDASLLACLTPFSLTDPYGPLATRTVAAVERQLLEPGGGVHRYRGDVFYGGGQWPVLAGLLGWHHARTGRTAAARRQLDWIAAQATGDGLLPEQAPGARLLHPEHLARWVEEWGPNATPLLWSHAMYLILADALDIRP